jgi:hypothetical protein
MRIAIRKGGATLLGLVSVFCSESSGGDNVCHKAPKCWQYHRDVCFGHYQTKWRSWGEACGSPVASVAKAGPPSMAPNGLRMTVLRPAATPVVSFTAISFPESSDAGKIAASKEPTPAPAVAVAPAGTTTR